jgi:hypothetical protein
MLAVASVVPLEVPQTAFIVIMSGGVAPIQQPKLSSPVRVMEPADATAFEIVPDANVVPGGLPTVALIVHVPDQGAVRPGCFAVKVMFAAKVAHSGFEILHINGVEQPV